MGADLSWGHVPEPEETAAIRRLNAVKAAKWDRIAAAWERYCTGGAGAFDWDYDSRDLMRELTAGDQP
jgi:hypothetical protein